MHFFFTKDKNISDLSLKHIHFVPMACAACHGCQQQLDRLSDGLLFIYTLTVRDFSQGRNGNDLYDVQCSNNPS